MCLQYPKYFPRRRPRLHSHVLARKIGKAKRKVIIGYTKKTLLSDTNKNY